MDPGTQHASIPEGRCAKCRKIPWRYSEWVKNGPVFRVDHHESWAALIESAAAGCDLCRSLRARVIHESGANIPQGVPCVLRITFFDSGSGFLPEYTIGDKKEDDVLLVIRRADGVNIQRAPLVGIKRFSPETQQADLDALIRERIEPWIADCIHRRGRHVDCKPVSVEGQKSLHLPTRLIAVGDGKDHPARLVESKDLLSLKPKPEYLALSYCWGQSNEPAKTTRANLQARKQRLEEHDFPKTIRDAISLTRRMRIGFLWVDAICIIQPSSQDPYLGDWEEEASMMASYYANARCLISALAAFDSSQGIFAERPAQRYPQTNTPIAFDEARNETLYLPVDELIFHKQFNTQPLLTRGWCFQERLLSPRALHWAANCPYWQCQSLTQASEQDPEDKLPRFMPVFTRDEPQIFQRDAEFALTSSWLRAVVEYMRTSFTYLTDRLIAIESLGTRLDEIHGVEYFAGVFSSELTRGLLWRLMDDSESCEKLSYFPSWSWASSLSAISYPVEFEYAQNTKLKILIRVGGRGGGVSAGLLSRGLWHA